MKIGTRQSKLALVQTEMVMERLREQNIDCEIVKMTTVGDRRTDLKLTEFGGKGAFVNEIEQAILSGDIDIAVHSAKDLPLELMNGLTIGAVLKRDNPFDALVKPKNRKDISIVGTGSLRRQAQLSELYGWECKNIRGNIDTRLKKATEEYDAVVLAMAGIDRMDFKNKYTDFDFEQLPIVPAACQGIIAVECKAESEVYNILRNINDADTELAFACERAFIKAIELGCQSPVGAYASVNGNNIEFEAVVYGKERHYIKKQFTAENAVFNAAETALELKRKLNEE